jgi:hypothetical protein
MFIRVGPMGVGGASHAAALIYGRAPAPSTEKSNGLVPFTLKSAVDLCDVPRELFKEEWFCVRRA